MRKEGLHPLTIGIHGSCGEPLPKIIADIKWKILAHEGLMTLEGLIEYDQ